MDSFLEEIRRTLIDILDPEGLYTSGGKNSKAQPKLQTAEEAIQTRRVAFQMNLDKLEKRIVFLQQRLQQQEAKVRNTSCLRDEHGQKMAVKEKKLLESQLAKLIDMQLMLQSRLVTLQAPLSQSDDELSSVSMSTQTALPTLLGSCRHQQAKSKIQKPSPAQAQAPQSRSLKKPHSREEKLLLLPHNGIRFLMDELLNAVRSMDPSVQWKWENLDIWYDEYFYLTVQQHSDAEENIYLPWVQATRAKIRMSGLTANDREQQYPLPMKALDVTSEVIKAGRQADHSQKSGIQVQLCQVVEEMVSKMHDHLAEQEEIVPRLIKKAGCTRAEQDTLMMETIQSLTFNSNKVVLPIMVHALMLSSGLEKAEAFVQNLPLPDRFLYTSSWAPDFQTRHQLLIRSVHKDETSNPEVSQ